MGEPLRKGCGKLIIFLGVEVILIVFYCFLLNFKRTGKFFQKIIWDKFLKFTKFMGKISNPIQGKFLTSSERVWESIIFVLQKMEKYHVCLVPKFFKTKKIIRTKIKFWTLCPTV
jgi:hypothetical protein